MNKKYNSIEEIMLDTELSIDERALCVFLDLRKTWLEEKERELDVNIQRDEKYNQYLVITNQEMMDYMKIKGTQKIVSLKKGLEKRGLLRQLRQFDNSNRYYLLWREDEKW